MNSIIKQEILSQLESNEQFPVDFDIYWKWLEFSTKGNAKRAFEKAGFVYGQDFSHIIISDNVVKRTQGGGTQLEKLMLTIDCAKSFAMMARTEKGKEIRSWYLQLEKEWRSGKLQQATAERQKGKILCPEGYLFWDAPLSSPIFV